MRSLTERQWQRYFELVEQLDRLAPHERRSGLSALRSETEGDIFALLELHLGQAPDIDRCRSGERIRNLVLGERIGGGGMGVVYRATQTFADGIERQVAVKLIHPALMQHEPELSQHRFRHEIGTLVRLEHKGIARIYDGGHHRGECGDDCLYFAMELVDGQPLSDYVAAHRARLGIAGILRLFLLVCDAVAHAHRQGVVHRDIKPGNILVDAAGEPRVIDFGLADTLGGSAMVERAGLVCGTPAYMSPEQLGGDAIAAATPASDVYALGITLHELLAGRLQGCPGEIGDRALAQIIGKATAPCADERHPSAAAFGDDLRARLEAIEAHRATLLRARRSLASKVRSFWIDGVLQHSLHAALTIELGLALQPGAVERAWDLVVQTPGGAARAVAPGQPIADVFEAAGHTLLILGAPGAGKTTLLLELAASLLERARRDETQPVPVVFHLSTWADGRLPLADWLVDELDKRYDLAPATARLCLAERQLVPLLDGLDEVAPAHRAGCVAAINAFRRQDEATRLAVCCRLADSEALPVRLRLAQAVVIQPLTRRQIDDYIERAGPRLAGVRAALQRDEELRELLTTPLLLSIAALAYQQRAPVRPATAATPAQRRAQLFDAYAEAMFMRRSPVTRYTPERSTRWLGWLASAMLAHHQSVFYLEWMQPSWLPRPLERWAAGGGSIVLCGLLTGLVLGLGGHFAGDFAFSMPVSLLLGLAGGLAFGFSGWGDQIRPVTRLGWSLSSLRQGTGTKLARAAGVGLMLYVGVSLVFDRAAGLTVGLTATLAFCYFAGLDLQPAPSDGDRITEPNQGIRQSLRNAVRGALAGAAIGAVAAIATVGLPAMLFLVPLFGLITTLLAGAYPCLQHLILRLLLWRNGLAPWRYAEFLAFATERIFVHRVGGGYAFVHRALMEYFAGLYSRR